MRSKDFPLAQGIVIVYGLIVLVSNLLIDIVLVCLDPALSAERHVMAVTSMSTPDSALAGPAAATAVGEPMPMAVSSRRRFLTVLRSPLGIGALAALMVVAFFAVFGPVLWGEVARQADLTQLSAKPSADHLLGTDAGGRDVLARVLTATRLSIVTAVLSAALGVFVGVVIGLLPTIAPRRLGRLVNSAIGVALAFRLSCSPSSCRSPSVSAPPVSHWRSAWPWRRPTPGSLTTLGASVTGGDDFVAAARILGVGRARILVRHVLPNMRDPLIVNASIGAGTALVAATGLSSLGLGVQAPDYDWGRMLKREHGSHLREPRSVSGARRRHRVRRRDVRARRRGARPGIRAAPALRPPPAAEDHRLDGGGTGPAGRAGPRAPRTRPARGGAPGGWMGDAGSWRQLRHRSRGDRRHRR